MVFGRAGQGPLWVLGVSGIFRAFGVLGRPGIQGPGTKELS